VAVQGTQGSGSETVFKGNPALETGNPGQCVLSVQVNEEPAYLLVQVLSGSGDDVCPIATAAMEIAFDHLPSG